MVFRASQFYADKLRCETDPADVRTDMETGLDSFVVLDARSEEDYALKHVTGALQFRIRQRGHRGLFPRRARACVGNRSCYGCRVWRRRDSADHFELRRIEAMTAEIAK